MKSAVFEYHSPDSVEEACALLQEHEDGAKVMAGGQSLVPMLNMRLANPDVIVDISRIPRLRGAESAVNGCRYGSAVVHSSFEDGVVPDPTRGLLARAASGIGYRAIRNRGTLGGSLSHADASAEWPIVMAALDAQLMCESTRGVRTIPARDYVLGYFTNALEDDEVLTEIFVPTVPPDVRWGLHKTARKPGEFAESLAVVLVGESDDVVTSVTAWLGASGDSPRNLGSFEELVSSRPLREVTQAEVMAAVAESLPTARTEDERFHVHLHGMTTWRALSALEGT